MVGRFDNNQGGSIAIYASAGIVTADMPVRPSVRQSVTLILYPNKVSITISLPTESLKTLVSGYIV